VKPPVERAARALCRLHDVPADATFEGKPMWVSYLPEVDAVLSAALSAEELQRLSENSSV
jgi:hypothetical protein